jgi:Ni,Fe-hydrogenase maturation factor
MIGHVVLGMALLVIAVVILGNMGITWLFRSDTKRVQALDVVKVVNNYRTSLNDPQLRQALAILDRDSSYYDAKVSNSLVLCLIASAVIAVGIAMFTGGFLIAAIVFVVAAVLSVPISAVLAKATVEGSARTEREAFRSVLAMYLMVFGVELRTHPVEIALREMEEVTYSPVAFRITREIQERIDSAVQSAGKDGTTKDTSLAQAILDLGHDWAIPELELIGETMHGSVFSPEALSNMILEQAHTMKQSLMRAYAKKLEGQRPKLSVFALLQIMPLLVFIVVPMLTAFGKSGL